MICGGFMAIASCHAKPYATSAPKYGAASDCVSGVATAEAGGNRPARTIAYAALNACHAQILAAQVESVENYNDWDEKHKSTFPEIERLGKEAEQNFARDIPTELEELAEIDVDGYRTRSASGNTTRPLTTAAGELARPSPFLTPYQQRHGADSCSQDCSGHEAGYKWAAARRILRLTDCVGEGRSFIDGCRAYVEDTQIDDK